MTKAIIITEEEYSHLHMKFIDAFIEQSKKGYGVSLVSNETGETLKTVEEIGGGLLLPWKEVFKY